MSRFIKINDWHIDLFEIAAVAKDDTVYGFGDDDEAHFIHIFTKGGKGIYIEFKNGKVIRDFEYDKLIKILERKEKGEEALVVSFRKVDELEVLTICVDYIKDDFNNKKFVYKPIYQNKEVVLKYDELDFVSVNGDERYENNYGGYECDE